jgi:uncharacterized protein (TIGR00255 family)
MTGFGTAEGEVAGRRARVEIRTVNHRWFNLSARLPSDLAALEADLRDALRRQFERGHVNVQVHWADDESKSAVDLGRAQQVIGALRDLQARFGLAGDVTVELVARQADVFGVRAGGSEPVAWAALAPVVATAANECRAARQREGAVLMRDLVERVNAIRAAADRIDAKAPARLIRERDRLAANVRMLASDRTVDEARIAQEIAIAADRLDISEELVRLRGHLDAAAAALGGEAAIGKQLGFLAQEMGREINTIGSKANDAEIAGDVVAMKGELEKVREQLENIE